MDKLEKQYGPVCVPKSACRHPDQSGKCNLGHPDMVVFPPGEKQCSPARTAYERDMVFAANAEAGMLCDPDRGCFDAFMRRFYKWEDRPTNSWFWSGSCPPLPCPKPTPSPSPTPTPVPTPSPTPPPGGPGDVKCAPLARMGVQFFRTQQARVTPEFPTGLVWMFNATPKARAPYCPPGEPGATRPRVECEVMPFIGDPVNDWANTRWPCQFLPPGTECPEAEKCLLPGPNWFQTLPGLFELDPMDSRSTNPFIGVVKPKGGETGTYTITACPNERPPSDPGCSQVDHEVNPGR